MKQAPPRIPCETLLDIGLALAIAAGILWLIQEALL